MKRFVCVFFILVFLSFFTLLLSDINILFSQSQPNGCCKQRDSITNSNWYKNNLNFRDCDYANRVRDNDNISKPTGLIWWDVACK